MFPLIAHRKIKNLSKHFPNFRIKKRVCFHCNTHHYNVTDSKCMSCGKKTTRIVYKDI